MNTLIQVPQSLAAWILLNDSHFAEFLELFSNSDNQKNLELQETRIET